MTAPLLDVPAAAAALGLSTYQVRAAVDAGTLPHRRVGRFIRFTDADLDTYLSRIAVDPVAAPSGQTQRSRRRSA